MGLYYIKLLQNERFQQIELDSLQNGREIFPILLRQGVNI